MAQDKGRGNLIKEQLKAKGYTQVWLAEQLGVSFSITNAYVCNRKQPNLKTIFKIADLLGVSPKDLVF
ncbi:helix-turn-helix transcriptional regulator [Capnocytophaga sp. Marseille-Q4570]|uniref:Helix-turn-helix transcriptional regulator n=1 Tax=Capnocytophaga bilenii TaxID=2819369 RepID=A0ABS3PW17_9FLAO|nr:helix-turn-helix transcriptional regulator [Capnocytophaga bilenii]MBO1883114.1 helix-turn-helix transcriptional regulator [Capnocytophaga bilenii]